MSAEPRERWRQRLHDVFRLRETLAEARDGEARQRARLRRAALLREAAVRRCEMFGAELFAEPAFDLLLDLYLAAEAEPDQRDRPAAVPNRRCAAAMEQRGLVMRESVGGDPRRARLRLTPEAVEAMERYLDGI